MSWRRRGTSSGEKLRVVVLAGGTGSAKLLRGLAAVSCEFTVIANVGDNVWMHGLYVCPDVDIATYTLAGIADRERGWGIRGDTFNSLEQMAVLGAETWFRLGDRDLALHVLRTEMVRGRGMRLTEVTDAVRKRLGVEQRILPVTDDSVETRVLTESGDMHLQEFWVKLSGRPEVKAVVYRGADRASPTAEVADAIRMADRVIFCPANPVTSISPILAVSGMREMLAKSSARRVAVSPMLGRAPFSGPAGKMLRAVGFDSSSAGVAKMYSGVVDAILVDRRDADMKEEVERAGVECILSDIEVKGEGDEKRLAEELLKC